MLLLGETYMKMHKRKKARTVLRQLLSLYPESAFGVPAKGFLSLMQDQAVANRAPLQ